MKTNPEVKMFDATMDVCGEKKPEDKAKRDHIVGYM